MTRYYSKQERARNFARSFHERAEKEIQRRIELYGSDCSFANPEQARTYFAILNAGKDLTAEDLNKYKSFEEMAKGLEKRAKGDIK